MSAPTDIVIVVSAANSVPPVIRVEQKVFRTEVQ
jgi:hypothetical protein